MNKTRAVVLKSSPFGEDQRIVRLYSEHAGYLSLITPPSFHRKKSNPVSQPMQLVEVEYFENNRGGLHKLKTISTLRNTTAIYFDIVKMNIALLWGEVLDRILQHEERNGILFDYICDAVEYLHTAGREAANFNLCFLYRLCGLLGFRIDTDSYSEGALFNIGDGKFYPPGVSPEYTSGPHTARIIRCFCASPLEEALEVPLNGESRGVLLDVVLHFLGFHLNIDFNNKNLQVIREVFR